MGAWVRVSVVVGGPEAATSLTTFAFASRSKPSQWDFLTVAYCLSMETAVTAALFLDLYYWIVLVGVQVRVCINTHDHVHGNGAVCMLLSKLGYRWVRLCINTQASGAMCRVPVLCTYAVYPWSHAPDSLSCALFVIMVAVQVRLPVRHLGRCRTVRHRTADTGGRSAVCLGHMG